MSHEENLPQPQPREPGAGKRARGRRGKLWCCRLLRRVPWVPQPFGLSPAGALLWDAVPIPIPVPVPGAPPARGHPLRQHLSPSAEGRGCKMAQNLPKHLLASCSWWQRLPWGLRCGERSENLPWDSPPPRLLLLPETSAERGVSSPAC